jgi:HemY protein
MGAVREWLARGSRAPSDAAWIADGIISSQWAPISPVTGKLDAFEWRQPDERLDYIEAMPEAREEIETQEAPALTAPKPVAASEAAAEEIVPAPENKGDGSDTDSVPAVAETSAETEAARPHRARRSSASRPVMFAQPVPPDDPGTEPEKVRRVV